jgi:hypothetical protein
MMEIYIKEIYIDVLYIDIYTYIYVHVFQSIIFGQQYHDTQCSTIAMGQKSILKFEPIFIDLSCGLIHHLSLLCLTNRHLIKSVAQYSSNLLHFVHCCI